VSFYYDNWQFCTFEDDVGVSILNMRISLGPADVAAGVRGLRIADNQSTREGAAAQRVGDDLVVESVAVGDGHAVLEPGHLGVDRATQAAFHHQFVTA